MAKKLDPKRMNQAQQMNLLKEQLGYVTFEQLPQAWFRTGSRRLNYVIGSKELGVPYGKILTLAGAPSSGKTLLALRLMWKAQQDGATIGWVDIENSFDAEWAGRQGLQCGVECEDIALFKPEFGVFVKSKENQPERLETAEQLFNRVERWLTLQRKIGNSKVALAIDSTTAIQPEEELNADLTDQNMRTKLALASFLNLLTKKMVALAYNTNAFVVLVSQLRENPMKMFGDKRYLPGGNGVLFYPSSINWMTKVTQLREAGKVVGIGSKIENRKNKMGGGSVEGGVCGVRMFFDSTDWEFVDNPDVLKPKKKKKGR